MRHILFVVATLLSSFPARAESPAYHCGDWWQVTADVPLHIEEVPIRPNIFLPVREPRWGWGGWGETPVVVTTLTVQVTGASGHQVTGELDILNNDRGGPLWTDGIVRWRALEDLVVGERYTVEVVVPDSPTVWYGLNCPSRPGFVQTLTFDVVDSPPESPVIDMSVSGSGAWESEAYYGYCRSLDDLRCADPPGICCWLWGFWTTKATVAVSGSMPPPIYTLLELNFEHDSTLSDTRRLQGGALMEPFDVMSRQLGLGQPPEGGLCVRASVHSLLRDTSFGPLATVRVCSGFLMPEAPILEACRPDRCADYGYLFEPGPEQVEEPPVEEALADPEPSDDASPDDVGSETKPSSGCAGGGVPGGVFVVVLGWFVRRRRWVAHGLVVWATVWVGSKALAEQPGSPCEDYQYAWWELANDIPTHLTQVPLRPNIFLPARAPHRSIPEDERYGPNVLEVMVTDAQGNAVAGSVEPAA